jgi:hypothetical protein
MVSIEAVWDKTSEFISDHFGDVLRIAVPLGFVPMAVMGVAMPLITREPTTRNMVLGLAVLVASLVTLWGNLALTALVVEPVGGRGAVRAALGRLPAKVLVSVVELLVIGLAIVPILVVFGSARIVTGQMSAAGAYPAMGLGSASFILIYTLVLVGLLLVLFARLLLVDAALVAEQRGLSALLRSLALTRGLTLKLVGVLLLYIIVSQVAALATRTVFGAILGLFTIGAGPVNVATIVTAIAVAVVQTIFSVLAVVFTARLFVAVRAGREAIVELA